MYLIDKISQVTVIDIRYVTLNIGSLKLHAAGPK